MINEQEVAQFIIERMKQSPGMLGAPLGALTNAQFPGINFRLNYGGLRAFVEQFCGSEVEIIRGQWGKDDLYQLRSAGQSGEASGTAPASSETAASPIETPWKVFTVPESRGRLYVNPESETVKVAQAAGPVPEPPFVEVPKLTSEEHHRFATEFLPQIEMDERERFQELLAGENFWQRWFAATRTFAGGKYLKPWLTFRFDRICELLRERLRALGISDIAALICVEKVKQSKAADRPVPAVNKRIPMTPSTSIGSLYDVARAALDAMSEEELRRIWLPLGVVADAIRRRESQ